MSNIKGILSGTIFILLACAILLLGGRWFKRTRGDKPNPYEYDIEVFKHVDPNLLIYRQIRQIKVKLTSVGGLTVDNQDGLWVTGADSLLTFDSSGEIIHSWDLDFEAHSIAVTADGQIVLASRNRIALVDQTGRILSTWDDFDENTVFTSLAVTAEDVYAADAGNRVVLRLSRQGKPLGRIAEKDPDREIPGLLIPSPHCDVAIDPDGFLWIVNPGRHSLENYTTTGDLRSFWGKPAMTIDGFCGCCNPTDMAILSDGSFVTSEKGLVRVKVFSQTGELVGVVAGPDQFFEGTVGVDLAVDSAEKSHSDLRTQRELTI